MKGKGLTEKDVQRIRKLHNSKYNFDIAKRIGCSEGAVNSYKLAFDAGFETPGEYRDAMAKKAGYENHGDRYAVSNFLKDKAMTQQEEFEQSMETRGLIRNSRAYLTESIVPDLDIGMDREDALEILAKKHHAKRVSYDSPNPSGAREVAVITSIFYDGKTLKKTAKEMNISLERVRQLKNKGLKHLHDIMTKSAFR